MEKEAISKIAVDEENKGFYSWDFFVLEKGAVVFVSLIQLLWGKPWQLLRHEACSLTWTVQFSSVSQRL